MMGMGSYCDPRDPRNWPGFDLPDSEWEPAGADDDPKARLMCAVYLNGVPMHVEAFAVLTEDDDEPWQQVSEASYGDELVEAIHAHNGYPGEPLHTWRIGGRDYVIVLTPFHD